jgi:hypothetical protein
MSVLAVGVLAVDALAVGVTAFLQQRSASVAILDLVAFTACTLRPPPPGTLHDPQTLAQARASVLGVGGSAAPAGQHGRSSR